MRRDHILLASLHRMWWKRSTSHSGVTSSRSSLLALELWEASARACLHRRYREGFAESPRHHGTHPAANNHLLASLPQSCLRSSATGTQLRPHPPCPCLTKSSLRSVTPPAKLHSGTTGQENEHQTCQHVHGFLARLLVAIQHQLPAAPGDRGLEGASPCGENSGN